MGCDDDMAAELLLIDATMREAFSRRPGPIFSLYFNVTINRCLTGRGESLAFSFRLMPLFLAFIFAREGSGVGVLTFEDAAGLGVVAARLGVGLPAAGRLCTDMLSPCPRPVGRVGTAETRG